MFEARGLISLVVYIVVIGLVFWLLNDMSPGHAVHDAANLRSADSQFVGHGLLGNAAFSIPAPDLPHQSIVQLRSRSALATGHLAFGGSILHVLGMAAKEQVSWIDAAGIISTGAVVADLHAFGDWTISQFPGYAGSKKCLPWRPAIPSPFAVGHRDMNLRPATAATSRPEPTTIGLQDLRPESSDQCRRMSPCHGSRSSGERGCGRAGLAS